MKMYIIDFRYASSRSVYRKRQILLTLTIYIFLNRICERKWVVYGLADEIVYQNMLGLNVLTIQISG